MARGISETDVHQAADALVAAGERPTVERVRAHLGTGSPNTVIKWLESWWQCLGPRLEGHRLELAVPDAPEAVTALAGKWWSVALAHGHEYAKNALAAEHLELSAARSDLAQERKRLADEAATVRVELDAAIHASQLAHTQVNELQRLLHQHQAQLEDLLRQRDVAQLRAEELGAEKQILETRLESQRVEASKERDSLAQHVQAIENRAHAEVDRARQETSQLQARVDASAREYAIQTKASQVALEHAKSEADSAIREANMQCARADALEAQLAKLQDLPAALEAALRNRELGPVVKKLAAKRAKPRTGHSKSVKASRSAKQPS